MDKLERFIVLLYSRTSDDKSVNSTRLSLFCQMSRPIDNIPPPEHRWRSIPGDLSIKVDLSGPFWGHCLEKRSDIATASDWGWEVDGSKFMPKWTVLPIAEKVCLELISCKCTKPCRGNCKCYRANSVCTALCKCRGICYVI